MRTKNDLTAAALPPCAFCGRKLAYSITVNGQPLDGLFHGWPPCRKFIDLGVNDYLQANREELERQLAASKPS